MTERIAIFISWRWVCVWTLEDIQGKHLAFRRTSVWKSVWTFLFSFFSSSLWSLQSEPTTIQCCRYEFLGAPIYGWAIFAFVFRLTFVEKTHIHTQQVEFHDRQAAFIEFKQNVHCSVPNRMLVCNVHVCVYMELVFYPHWTFPSQDKSHQNSFCSYVLVNRLQFTHTLICTSLIYYHMHATAGKTNFYLLWS